MEQPRCSWCQSHPLLTEYHDNEWGIFKTDDIQHFEHISMEVFQAGFNWLLILKKRDGLSNAFKGFDPKIVADFNPDDVQRLMQDSNIIRNEKKITSVINNAGVFLKIVDEFSSFVEYLKQFGPKKEIIFTEQIGYVDPTAEAIALSKDLKKRGFKFMGPTVCYAHLQSTGIVNDHWSECFLFNKCNDIRKQHLK